ncbi:MAG: hypothetical protein ACI4TF_07105 [Oliverpabstia sp.]
MDQKVPEYRKKGYQVQKKESDEKDFYGISHERDFFSCSTTDCTGLIPAGIVSDAERESYKELYPSLTPPVVLSHENENHEKIRQNNKE